MINFVLGKLHEIAAAESAVFQVRFVTDFQRLMAGATHSPKRKDFSGGFCFGGLGLWQGESSAAMRRFDIPVQTSHHRPLITI